MRFSDIHGLTKTKHHLISSVQRNKVAHAQLFSGVEGSALLPMALAYGTYLNCEHPGDTDACGECAACTKSLKYVHPDIHFIYPVSGTEEVKVKDAVSKVFLPAWRKFLLASPYGNVVDWAITFGGENKNLNISKEESRQMIDALSLTAFEGRYKIMLIWMPEYLHPFAANGILKLLEEPAANTVFLLVSPQKDRLLGTIRSRTQLVQIPAFSDEEMVHILTREYQLDEEKARQLAQLADGSLRTALQLHEEADLNLHDMFIDWMRLCFARDYLKISDTADKFAGLAKAAQKTFLLYGLQILRESLVAGFEEDKLLRIRGNSRTFVKKFSQTLNMAAIDLLAAKISDAHYYLERNANAKIVFMNLSMIFTKSFNR